MSLDQHYPLLADRRFQPSERSTYPPSSSHHPSLSSHSQWNQYVSRSPQPQHPTNDFQLQNNNQWDSTWSDSVSHHAPYRSSAATFGLTASDYHDQRSLALPSSPSLRLSNNSYSRNFLRQTTSASSLKFDAESTWGTDLYTLEPDAISDSAIQSSYPRNTLNSTNVTRSVRSASTPVKLEPNDDIDSCFVMEFSSSPGRNAPSQAPPTEVPLRATQASKEMRRMMGVFRLNPFSMHEGGGGASAPWCGEDPGPLEEEPLVFEFQLDVYGEEDDRTASPPLESDRFPSVSPDVEDSTQHASSSHWAERQTDFGETQLDSHHQDWLSDSVNTFTSPSLSLDLDYPTPHQQHSRQHPHHLAPYIPHSSPCSSASSGADQIEHRQTSSSVELSWSRRNMFTYTADNAYDLAGANPCSNAFLTSCTAANVTGGDGTGTSMTRRWSNSMNLPAPYVL